MSTPHHPHVLGKNLITDQRSRYFGEANLRTRIVCSTNYCGYLQRYSYARGSTGVSKDIYVGWVLIIAILRLGTTDLQPMQLSQPPSFLLRLHLVAC